MRRMRDLKTPTKHPKHLPTGQNRLSNLYKRLPTGRLCRDTNEGSHEHHEHLKGETHV